MIGRCLACRQEAEIADPRNGFGRCCEAARVHVVSMTRATLTGDSVASCIRCGWTNVEPWGAAGRERQDAKVRAHWQAVVAEAAGR